MKNIVWIASYPKSGNTWVRALLQVALGGRLDLNSMGELVPNFASLASRLSAEAFERPGDIRFLWRAAQEKLAGGSAGGKVLLKTHNVCGRFDVGQFPDAGFTAGAVYVVRDPRDVAISFSHHFGLSVEKAVESLLDEGHVIHKDQNWFGSEILSSWETHVRSWRAAPFPVLVLRYEDLLASPEVWIPKVLSFLRVTPMSGLDEQSLKSLIEEVSFARMADAERREGFREAVGSTAFFREGRAEQWRRHPQSDFAALIERYGATMKQLGYLGPTDASNVAA